MAKNKKQKTKNNWEIHKFSWPIPARANMATSASEIAGATWRTYYSAVATGLILPLPSNGAFWAMPTDRQHVLQCAVAKNLSNSVKQYGKYTTSFLEQYGEYTTSFLGHLRVEPLLLM